jgi:hypothetical protein
MFVPYFYYSKVFQILCKPWNLGLMGHVVDIKTKYVGWPPWHYKKSAMCFGGNMWCGRDDVP